MTRQGYGRGFSQKAEYNSNKFHVRKGVWLPGGNVVDSSDNYYKVSPAVRNRRSYPNRNEALRKSKSQTSYIQNRWRLSPRLFILAVLSLLFISGILLLAQWNSELKLQHELDSVISSITVVNNEKDYLSSVYQEAVSETVVAYTASQHLGLISGQGADVTPLRVHDKYSLSASSAIQMGQSGYYLENGNNIE